MSLSKFDDQIVVTEHSCDFYRGYEVSSFQTSSVSSGSARPTGSVMIDGPRSFAFARDSLSAGILIGDVAAVSESHIYTRHDGLGYCVIMFISTSSRVSTRWELRINPMLAPQWGSKVSDFVDCFGFTAEVTEGDEWIMRGNTSNRCVVAGRPAIVGYRVLDRNIVLDQTDPRATTIHLNPSRGNAAGEVAEYDLTILSSNLYPLPWATVIDFHQMPGALENGQPTFYGVHGIHLNDRRFQIQGKDANTYVDSGRALTLPAAIRLSR